MDRANRGEWQTKFKQQLHDDKEARDGWKFLVAHGCNADVLEDLAYGIGLEESSISQDIQNSARSSQMLHYYLATSLAEMAQKINDLIPLCRGKLQSNMMHIEKLMRLEATRKFDQSETSPFAREAFEPGVALFAAYVLKVTNGKNYRPIAAIIRCAFLMDDPNGGFAADAVRKAVTRYEEDQPFLWDLIKQAVNFYVVASTAKSFVEPAREFPSLHSHFWNMLSESKNTGQIVPSITKLNVRDANLVKRYLRQYGKWDWDEIAKLIKSTTPKPRRSKRQPPSHSGAGPKALR